MVKVGGQSGRNKKLREQEEAFHLNKIFKSLIQEPVKGLLKFLS